MSNSTTIVKKRVRSWDIAEYIRKEIRRKSLMPNTPVMSARALATHFNASSRTANRALDSLVKDDVLYRVPGEGGTSDSGQLLKGRLHRMTLGRHPIVNLKEARARTRVA